jgi:hypothetical protein
MANTDNAFGFRPIMSKDGSGWNGKVTKYFIPSTLATDVFIGDAVVKTGTANTATILGNQPGVLPALKLAAATATTPITGIVVGFDSETDESKVYGAASTNRVALVVDDPRCVFEVQCSGDFDAVDTGLNAQIVVAAGSTVTNQSAYEVLDTFAVTVTSQIKALRLADKEDNALGTNAIVEVIINNHTESNSSLGL